MVPGLIEREHHAHTARRNDWLAGTANELQAARASSIQSNTFAFRLGALRRLVTGLALYVGRQSRHSNASQQPRPVTLKIANQ